MLIAYNQRGQVGIMQLEKGKLRILNEFNIEEGTGAHYAMPSLFQNTLLIRHGNTLLGYQI